MRLLLVTFTTLVVLTIVFFSVRFWGLSQVAQTFDHPWYHLEKPWIVVPWALREQAPARAILWVDVDRKDENLVVGHEDLKAVLAKLQDRNIILNIRANERDVDLQVSDLVGKSGEGRLMIQSDYDVVMSSIKRLQPRWLFGASPADQMRFTTFASLWLLPATPFKGDVYVTPFRKGSVSLVDGALISEIHRRGLRVILGPLQNKTEANLALGLGADGVFIDQAELLRLTFPL